MKFWKCHYTKDSEHIQVIDVSTNHILNREKKLNPMIPKSQFQTFFSGTVYTVPLTEVSFSWY